MPRPRITKPKVYLAGLLLLALTATGCVPMAMGVAVGVGDSHDKKRERVVGAAFEAVIKANAAATGYELDPATPGRIASEVFATLEAAPIDCWQDFPGVALCAELDIPLEPWMDEDPPGFTVVYARADLDDRLAGALPLNPWTHTGDGWAWRSYVLDGMQVVRVNTHTLRRTTKIAVVFEPAD